MTPVTCISVLAIATAPDRRDPPRLGRPRLDAARDARVGLPRAAGSTSESPSPHRARDSADRWLAGRLRDRPERRADPRRRRSRAGASTRSSSPGGRRPRKGLQVLLRAWPEIRRRTGARLQICGSDPLAVRLLLTRLRVPDDGHRHPRLPPAGRADDAARSTKALVAPSLGGESFGMVLTRAFACAAARRRVGHPGIPRGDDPRDVGARRAGRPCCARRAPSQRSSRTSRAAPRWGPRRAPSPSSATRGPTSPAGSKSIYERVLETRRAVPREPVRAPGAATHGREASSSSRSLVAALLAIWWRGPDWTTVYHAFDFVSVALGRRRRRPQPPLGPRAVALVAADDRPGAARAAPALRSGVLGVRGRVARQRRAPRPRRRARPGRGPPSAPAPRERDERDAARDGLRAPAVRPVPRRVPRHLGAADGEDPALGGHEPRDLRSRRRRAADGRAAVRRASARVGARRHGRPARGCS